MSWVRGLRAARARRALRRGAAPATRRTRRAVSWFEAVTERFGLAGRATLLRDGEAIVGPAARRARRRRRRGDARQHQRPPDARPRCFDAFRQPRDGRHRPRLHAVLARRRDSPGANVEGHDLYFTIGELIGTPGCPIPTGGIDWRPVRQPVVLDDWPVVERGRARTGSRRSRTGAGPFGPIEHDGRTYGLKVHEFRKFIELPRRSPQRLRDRARHPPRRRARTSRRCASTAGGSSTRATVAGDPDAFRAYVQGSGAEFSVAQGIYVETALRLVQRPHDPLPGLGQAGAGAGHGLQPHLPVGEGLVALQHPRRGGRRGRRHRRPLSASTAAAARRIAEEHFDAERVLARFCEQAGDPG